MVRTDKNVWKRFSQSPAFAPWLVVIGHFQFVGILITEGKNILYHCSHATRRAAWTFTACHVATLAPSQQLTWKMPIERLEAEMLFP